MKSLLFFWLGTGLPLVLSAQREYDVFLQSENRQPFYVRVHEIKYTAASNGMLTIPGFRDSSAILRIGFPGEQSSESPFRIRFTNRDLGFQLRRRPGDTWALYNWQQKEWVLPQPNLAPVTTPDSAIVRTVVRDDQFALLMAAVTNDSSMLYSTVEQKIKPSPKPRDSIAGKKLEGAVVQAAEPDSIDLGKPDIALSRDTGFNKGGMSLTGLKSGGSDSAKLLKNADFISNVSAVGKDSIVPLNQDSVFAGNNIKQPDSSMALTVPISEPVNAGLKTTTVAALPGIPDSVHSLQAGLPVAADSAQTHRLEPMAGNKEALGVDTVKATAAVSLLPVEVPLEDSNTAQTESTRTNPVIGSKAGIRKLLENNFKDGKQLVFEDSDPSGRKDTIRITIPTVVGGAGRIEDLPVPVAQGVQIDSGDQHRLAVLPGDSSGVPSSLPARNKSVLTDGDSVGIAPSQVESPRSIRPDSSSRRPATLLPKHKEELVMINSDCLQVATDQDVDKLRIELLRVRTVDERIVTAEKVFRTECFTTRQVRALSELFPGDKAMYRFFDAAFPFVSDSSHFRELIDLFTDPAYIARFKALVRMQ